MIPRPRFHPDRLLCCLGGLFGSPPQQQYVPAPAAPAAPADNSAAIAAANKERLEEERAVGRSATILTDYALATQQAPVRSPTLGAA